MVRTYLAGLHKRVGEDDTGDTPLPFFIFLHVIQKLRAAHRPRLDLRTLCALYMEFQGGVRVGEAAGALRGWQAGRQTKIYPNRLEVLYQDRKKSNTTEVVTLTRHTAKSDLDAGQAVLDLADEWGVHVATNKDRATGESYQWLDSYVLRINLQGLDASAIQQLKNDIRSSPEGPGMPPADTDDGKKLRDHLCAGLEKRPTGDEHRRYVNVAIGQLDELATVPPGQNECSDHDRIPTSFTQWWLAGGWDAVPDPAPVLRTTVRGNLTSPMPYTPGSLAGTLKAEFEEAMDTAEQTRNPDAMDEIAVLPLSLSGRPKWNSHSCRRGGAKRAQDQAHESKAEIHDINRHYGWMEEAKRGGRKRQTAYASTLPVQRRLRVTSTW